MILTLKTESIQDVVSSFSSVELQQAVNFVLLNVLLVCELKEPMSSTNFKYDG
jgi:hypothetical protein